MNNIIKDSLAALYRLENDALNSRDGYGYSSGDAETIRRAISENEALRRENEELQAKLDKANWQPIETAPKEGETKALYGCYKNGKWYTQITARGSGVGGLHVNVPTGFRSYTGATHWMPLPEPPK